MRAIRTSGLVAAALVLALGSSTSVATTTEGDQAPLVRGVVGAVELDAPASFGTFAVADGMFQHRDIPVTGEDVFTNDVRLLGPLDATLNYDIHRSGQEPIPAWGTMSIDDGAWAGTFTGIRRHDSQPFEIRAFLVGSGEHEGMCAVLDIAAGAESWAIDGVIHPLPMGT